MIGPSSQPKLNPDLEKTFTAERWAGAMEIGLTMLTAGTREPLRPAQAKQLLLAGFLGAKPFLKLHQAECFLLYCLAPFV